MASACCWLADSLAGHHQQGGNQAALGTVESPENRFCIETAKYIFMYIYKSKQVFRGNMTIFQWPNSLKVWKSSDKFALKKLVFLSPILG